MNISIYVYIFKFFFLKKTVFKKFSYKLTVRFCDNSTVFKNNLFSGSNTFSHLLGVNFNKLSYMLTVLFKLNKNILVVDYNHNYNYLPISHENLIGSSSKFLHKISKYFNLGAILFLNLNKKQPLFTKFLNLNLITIVADIKPNKKFDFNLRIGNTPIYNYLVYLYILNIYLKIKNNFLNTWFSIIFFLIY